MEKKSRPFFQTKSNEKIAFVKILETFQNFSSSIVKNLNIQRDETHLSKTAQDNPVLACIVKFSKRPSIVTVKRRMEATSNKSLLNINKDINF